MQTEIEAKFLNIDKDSIRTSLEKLGARLVESERLMRRTLYDFPDRRLQAKRQTLRIRDEGDKVTMTFKQYDEKTVDGTLETEVTVSSYKRACAIAEAMGLEIKTVQETKREDWIVDDVKVSLDTWPWIPTFIEVEGPSEEAVKEVAKQLGFGWKDAVFGSATGVYEKYFNVTREQINATKEFKFDKKLDLLKK